MAFLLNRQMYSLLYYSFSTDLNLGYPSEPVQSHCLVGSGSLARVISQINHLWLNHQC